MTETHGPAHLVRIEEGELRVGHPRSCPRWPMIDDEVASAYEYRCGVSVELEADGAVEALVELAGGAPEVVVEFWSEHEDDSAWGPGAYRSGIRIVG